MRPLLRLRLALIVTTTLLGAASCPPSSVPGSADNTPPGFITALVQLEPAAGGPSRLDVDLTQAEDVIRTQIGSDVGLHLSSAVGDSDTGITNVTVVSELRWRCRFQPGSQVIGVMQRAPIAFTPFTQPVTSNQTFGINLRADPVAQTGCDRSPGRGAVDISGFVRITATNGGAPALSDTTRTFIFDYEDAIGPATGTRLSAGRGTDTPYMAECRRKGVPIPPDWSPRSTAWINHGNVNDAGGNILQPGLGAYVWTYTHPRVRGACIALPRTNGGARGGLAGIICQSATTGHACFWDSRRRLPNNPGADTPPLDWNTEVLRIAELKDAMTLTNNDLVVSGVCTDCHHGENVFIVAPDNPVWEKVLRTADLGPNFTTRVESSSDTSGGRPRYIPVTGLGGTSRAGWSNPLRPLTCGPNCHEQPGSFPNPPTRMPPACGSMLSTLSSCYR